MSTTDSPDDLEGMVRRALVDSAERYTPEDDLEDRIAGLARQSDRHRRVLLAAAAAIVVVLAVGSIAVIRDDQTTIDMSPATNPTAPTTAAPAVPGTGTSLPTTESSTVVAPDSVLPVTPPSTVATPTTTTPPPADLTRVLRPDGIGDVTFGGSTGAAERAITALIGPSVTRFTDPECSARQIITWGSFAIWDQDGRITEWRFLGDTSLGLRTTKGIGIGSSAKAIVATYREAKVARASAVGPRDTVSITAPNGDVMWSAVLGERDEIIAMGAGPGDLWPASCPGRDSVLLSLTPHTAGLGMVALGSPRIRVLAALSAVYGPGVPDPDRDGGVENGCTLEELTTFRSTSPIVAAMLGDHFWRYDLRPGPDAPPEGISDPRGRIETGMTVADLQATWGALSFSTNPHLPDDHRTFDLGPDGADENVPGLSGITTGPTDSDTVLSIDSGLEDRC